MEYGNKTRRSHPVITTTNHMMRRKATVIGALLVMVTLGGLYWSFQNQPCPCVVVACHTDPIGYRSVRSFRVTASGMIRNSVIFHSDVDKAAEEGEHCRKSLNICTQCPAHQILLVQSPVDIPLIVAALLLIAYVIVRQCGTVISEPPMELATSRQTTEHTLPPPPPYEAPPPKYQPAQVNYTPVAHAQGLPTIIPP